MWGWKDTKAITPEHSLSSCNIFVVNSQLQWARAIVLLNNTLLYMYHQAVSHLLSIFFNALFSLLKSFIVIFPEGLS